MPSSPSSLRGLILPASVSNQPCRRAEEPLARSLGRSWVMISKRRRRSLTPPSVWPSQQQTTRVRPSICPNHSLSAAPPSASVTDSRRGESWDRPACTTVSRDFFFFFTPPASSWFATLSPRSPTELKWSQWSVFLFSALFKREQQKWATGCCWCWWGLLSPC